MCVLKRQTAEKLPPILHTLAQSEAALITQSCVLCVLCVLSDSRVLDYPSTHTGLLNALFM